MRDQYSLSPFTFIYSTENPFSTANYGRLMADGRACTIKMDINKRRNVSYSYGLMQDYKAESNDNYS